MHAHAHTRARSLQTAVSLRCWKPASVTHGAEPKSVSRVQRPKTHPRQKPAGTPDLPGPSSPTRQYLCLALHQRRWGNRPAEDFASRLCPGSLSPHRPERRERNWRAHRSSSPIFFAVKDLGTVIPFDRADKANTFRSHEYKCSSQSSSTRASGARRQQRRPRSSQPRDSLSDDGQSLPSRRPLAAHRPGSSLR